MKGSGKAKSRFAQREISGDSRVDAALWELAEILSEIAQCAVATPLGRDTSKEKPAADDGGPHASALPKHDESEATVHE